MQDLFDWFSHVQFGCKSNATYSSCLICVGEKEKGEGKLWHACYKSSWWHLMAISDLGDEKRALLLLRLIHLTCLSWKKKIFFSIYSDWNHFHGRGLATTWADVWLLQSESSSYTMQTHHLVPMLFSWFDENKPKYCQFRFNCTVNHTRHF